ncbi:MAG: hypothetical protein HY744_00555 [Deltaproteobacteria bacterium]|nr:hypothetical protein [Deltaproteobacteria bacterium]
MSQRRRPCHLLATVALAAATLSLSASAQSSDEKAAAEAAFQQAEKAMTAGDYAKACGLYEESLRHEKAMSAEFKLGECYENMGRLASAWSTYAEVAEWAKRDKEDKREQYARKRLAAIEPRLARLTIQVPDDVAALPGLRVERDGSAVGQPLWGEAVPVDLGTHRVAAVATGKARWTADVKVSGEGKTTTVRVPALEDEAAPAPGGPAAAPIPERGAEQAPGLGAAAPTGEPAGEAAPGRGQRIAGIVVAGVGLAGMGAGVALGLVAKGQYDDVGTHCPDERCDAEGLDTTDSARSLGDVATVVFIAGGAALVGGGVLWLTAPSADGGGAPAEPAKTEARLRWGLAPRAGGAALVAGGAW